jgi:oxygen-independent coproporphyrinogen III oxidase
MKHGLPPVEEPTTLDRRDAMAEFMFLGLRLLEGVELAAFQREFGEAVTDVYPRGVAELLDMGLLELAGDRLRLTRAGLPLANQVFRRFL